MMKILYAASNMVHINNFHIPYINALREQGNDVYIMASGEGADFDIPFDKKALSFKNFKLSKKIRNIIKEEKFDVVLVHTTLAAFWIRFAIRKLKGRPKVINTVHGYLFSDDSSFLKRKVYLFCEKMTRKVTDDILVMNQEDYEIATKNKLCKGEVILINGMGIDFARFKDNSRTNNSTDMLKMVFIGELSKRKNQIFLVKSLRLMQNVKLTLVGDGSEREKIEKYSRKFNLASRVEITGFDKDISKYLKNADLYVSSSKIEGLPFNILEAMYFNIPIVASDIKGQRDILPKECLFELGDINKFVSLVKNYKNKEFKYNCNEYSFDNVFSKNMKIYNHLIQQK